MVVAQSVDAGRPLAVSIALASTCASPVMFINSPSLDDSAGFDESHTYDIFLVNIIMV
jgi:hypothetical protein